MGEPVKKKRARPKKPRKERVPSTGEYDIPMRVTGAMAYHCREQGRGFGQTGAEFARSCIRKELARQGVAWDRWPEGEPSKQIEGQLKLDAARHLALPAEHASAFDKALVEHERVLTLAQGQAVLDALAKTDSVDEEDPFSDA